MTDETQEDVRAEMTRDGYLYGAGEDSWGAKVINTPEGRGVVYFRKKDDVEASLTLVDFRNNGHSKLGIRVEDKKGELSMLLEELTFPKDRVNEELNSAQNFVDELYFRNKLL